MQHGIVVWNAFDWGSNWISCNVQSARDATPHSFPFSVCDCMCNCLTKLLAQSNIGLKWSSVFLASSNKWFDASMLNVGRIELHGIESHSMAKQFTFGERMHHHQINSIRAKANSNCSGFPNFNWQRYPVHFPSIPTRQTTFTFALYLFLTHAHFRLDYT